MSKVIAICAVLVGCWFSVHSSLLPLPLPLPLPWPISSLLPIPLSLPVSLPPGVTLPPLLSPPLNPEIYNRTTPKQASYDGYTAVESHYVTTEDGYILNIFRIPYSTKSPQSSTPKPVVYLQHGLLSSSSCWLVQSSGNQLAYILADNGYDVWLGNARGNIYSRNHTTLDPDDADFWDFSYHESGVYDLPATIDYILRNTSQPDLTYIGHSMGTTMFFVLTSELPTYNEKINMMIALAPVAYTTKMTSPIAILAPFIEANLTAGLVASLTTSGTGEYQPNDPMAQLFRFYACQTFLSAYAFCSIPNFVLYGFDFPQVNTSMAQYYAGHYPQGTSIYTVLHLAQGVNSKQFQQYDYGSPTANKDVYGTTTPPLYNLANIKCNVTLIRGDNDWLADPTDVTTLNSQINQTVWRYYRVNDTQWNHGDFITAKDVYKYLYSHLLTIIKERLADLA